MSNTTKSLSMVVPAANRDAANRLMRGLGRDESPDPGRTFAVELNTSGKPSDAKSHYGAHTWDDTLVAVLDSGVLPGDINWSKFDLTKPQAKAALASIDYTAVVNREPRANFNQKLTDKNLKTVEETDVNK